MRLAARKDIVVAINCSIMSLEYKLVKAGEGPLLPEGSRVTVHYVGTFDNNQVVFESTRDRNEPLQVTIGKRELIKGWEIQLPKMKVGERGVLICPPDMAYGKNGVGNGFIPPNSTLVFDIEVLSYR